MLIQKSNMEFTNVPDSHIALRTATIKESKTFADTCYTSSKKNKNWPLKENLDINLTVMQMQILQIYGDKKKHRIQFVLNPEVDM